MTDMREYAAQHGWEVGSHLRYAGSTQPPSVITRISATEIRISTPGDFPGRLTGGSSSGLEKWTLDWQYRAEKAEATIQRVREAQPVCWTHAYSRSVTSSAPSPEPTMRDPYLDALEQLDQMRDRAFKAEATIRRLEAEVVNLSEELVLAKATIQRVRDAVEQNKSVIGDPGVAVIRQALDGERDA